MIYYIYKRNTCKQNMLEEEYDKEEEIRDLDNMFEEEEKLQADTNQNEDPYQAYAESEMQEIINNNQKNNENT